MKMVHATVCLPAELESMTAGDELKELKERVEGVLWRAFVVIVKNVRVQERIYWR